MKSLIAVLLFVPLSAFAKPAPKEMTNSEKIAAAVAGMAWLAESGVTEYHVQPTNSVWDALLELALNEKMIEDRSEFNWVGRSPDAWEADSSAWGMTSMKGAYSYIMTPEEQLVQDMDEQQKAQYEADLKPAKEAFKLLLNTGVLFGVVPIGAVQCGVSLPSLAIIDPHSGTIYVFSKEPSGC